jgi:hypothetical protein
MVDRLGVNFLPTARLQKALLFFLFIAWLDFFVQRKRGELTVGESLIVEDVSTSSKTRLAVIPIEYIPNTKRDGIGSDIV